MDIKSYLAHKFFKTSLVENDWEIATLGGVFLFKEDLEGTDSPGIISCLEIMDDKYEDDNEYLHPFTFSPSSHFKYYYQTYLGNSTTLCKALQKDSSFCRIVSKGEVLFDQNRLATLLVELAKEYNKVHEVKSHYANLSPVPGRMVGDKIKFEEEKQAYTIRARNDRFLICTKPFNLKKTVLYSIVDLHEGIRGTENLVFGMGAETDWQCWEMLTRLVEGTSEISRRNYIELKIAGG